MVLTIHVSPETEERLQRAASRQGMDPAEFARRLIEDHLPEDTKPLYEMLSPEELSKAFLEWANSHDPSLPVPPPEALERDSLYEGRP
jgi:hypothetical protein